MTQYPNATLNAEDSINVPPFPNGYRPKEIEVYLGDSCSDSAYHYRDGKWFDISLKNITDESVVQILIDDQWAYIQAGNEVLLDRLGGAVLPEVPNQEFLVSRISHYLQN
jgi:hypothetical protein